MWYKKIISVFLLGTAFFTPVISLAQYGLDDTATSLGYNKTQTVYTMSSQIVAVALLALGVIFFLIMLYAGIRWLTARDNDEFVKKSQEILQAATIGLVISLAAYAATRFIFQALGK